ncbi:pyridoxamine 5'-phosphate oxidase family protein [Acuticoccus sp. MNP-M23]|uniref:pyridoxamine 5'-phosphate oxidase family protein n=1 Tax=Acuticoccus sp. MNP-M23 TaxID=3072793 RepID=UPI002814A4A6|nr:pyridoxamine 5'-phosphate oxidase family protein [Acuticoccus sp. MNP-M23]WMS42963.1 pyridoxamine 5'-phosphate oxidase family protein [Acuticoccus sp. MNP-M23]
MTNLATDNASSARGADFPAHYHDLGAVERAAWDAMVDGVKMRKSAFHQVVVATVDEAGRPQARTVVLRGADEGDRTLRFHTDVRSAKIPELAAAPSCAIILYDHDAKIQVRVSGDAAIHNRDALTESLWGAMPHYSKACYRQPFGPGAPVETPEMVAAAAALGDDAGYANFVAITVAVNEFEWLYLAANGHRRARIDYRDAGGREWLAP